MVYVIEMCVMCMYVLCILCVCVFKGVGTGVYAIPP